MKKIIFLTIMVMMSGRGFGQNKMGFDTMVKSLTKGTIDTISSEQLAKKIEQEYVVLLDAREKPEYQVSHLPNAMYIGHEDFSLANLPDIPTEKTVVVYCAIGKRSEDVGLKLKEAGYNHVLNLFGGIFDWTNKGYEVVNDRNEPVTCVHPYSSFWGIWVNNLEKCYEPR